MSDLASEGADTAGTLGSWGEVSCGDALEWCGPATLDGPWVAPTAHALPYRFRHETADGGVRFLTDNNGIKLLESEHPATDASNWRPAEGNDGE